jgi:hypothetical protein
MDDPHARVMTDGQPHDVALALSLGGRINKTRERASRLYSSPVADQRERRVVEQRAADDERARHVDQPSGSGPRSPA